MPEMLRYKRQNKTNNRGNKMNSKYVRTGETTDYSMFISPIHQRKKTDSSVKAIMSSIQEHGVIAAISCRKSVKSKGKLESYDGQHTVQACKRLGVPVVYNVFEEVSNKAMISLNGKTRRWNMESYLHYGVVDNIDDYCFIEKIYKEERIPLTALLLMYGGVYSNIPFKDLEWKALTVKRGDIALSCIKDFGQIYKIEHSRHSRFIWGFCKVLDTGLYNHKRMMEQLSKCSQLMTKQANPEGYAKNIELVYNHGITAKNRVQFVQ